MPGIEGLGVVQDANGVEGFSNGQRVFPAFDTASGNGSWQEYVCIKADKLMKVDDALSDDAAAQMLVNPATALGLIETLAAPPGEVILQTAAGSQLGRMVIAIAKERRLRTINLIRTKSGHESQIEEMKALGADVVLAADSDDVPARVMEITGGKGVWGALDAVGGTSPNLCAQAVRQGGTVICYGALSGTTLTLETMSIIGRCTTLRGFMLPHFLAGLSVDGRKQVIEQVTAWLKSGVLKVPVRKRFKCVDRAHSPQLRPPLTSPSHPGSPRCRRQWRRRCRLAARAAR